MREYWIGEDLVGFDGTVLEVFSTQESFRLHVYHVRQFQLSAKLIAIVGPSGSRLLRFKSPEHASVAHAIIDAVNQARAARGWPAVPTT